jgi:molybdopterin-guanine dinucleotide biosynthesis protein A
MISRVAHTLQDVVDELVVSIAYGEDPEPYLAVLPQGAKVVPDAERKQTPLLGLYTALQATSSPYTCALSTDLPFASSKVVEALFHLAEGRDAAVPRWPDGRIEPLYAVYRRDPSLKALRSALDAGGLRMVELLNRLPDVVYVPVAAFKDVDPKLLCFFNVNTREDYEEAQRLARVKR